MFENILIPTDGSEPARNAADKGFDLAVEHGATVHGLYVVEPPALVGEGEMDQVIEAMQAAGEEAVRTFAEQAGANGLTATTDVRTGTPHREILEYIENNDIDLVVMGTQGRTGIDRYLLGSVTEKVVRLSNVPVLTIRSEADKDD